MRHASTTIFVTNATETPEARRLSDGASTDTWISVSVRGVQTEHTEFMGGSPVLQVQAKERVHGYLYLSMEHAVALRDALTEAIGQANKPQTEKVAA